MLISAALCGCHNRAYNDLYVENMAAEIRDLEDQLYEYDHEYKALEQELASLRAENELRAGASPKKAPLPNLPRSTDPEFAPRNSGQREPRSMRPESIDPGADSPDSILDSPEPEPSGSPFPRQNSASDDTLPPPTKLPAQPSGTPPSGNDFEFDSLLPPTIEPGEPMPPPSSGASPNPNSASVSPENDLELNLSRIEIPAQLAGRSSVGGAAQLTFAEEKITDTRVVELAFHPALSRAANFDDDSGDDGLVLVLLPKNERGQMVPSSADLSVVVLDPAREGQAARIGRWDYSAAEVKSKMQPIGSSQGIQLTLPWNGPNPSADRVIVFARYTYENGRQVIGQKEIFVTTEDGMKTVWTPRGNSSSADALTTTVRTAADSASTKNVVRPASGTAPLDPAPSPASRQW